MLNNEHIFKFDDSRLFHLRKYTLGFRQMIVTFELYIVKESSKYYVVSGRKNVMSMREFFCPDPLAGFEKMAGFQIFYCLKI